MKTSFRPEQGFTLIELMIAVGITAILATVAVTSYSSYVLRAHRTEAKSALLDLASLEERYLSTNNCYTATASALGYAALPLTIGSGYYQLQAPTWAATATWDKQKSQSAEKFLLGLFATTAVEKFLG